MTLSSAIGDTTENSILKLIFQAVAWTDYAINHTTTPQTNIGMSLHTADPGESGTAGTTEVGYTGYTRVNVLRDATNWTVTNNSCSPAAAIVFPSGTGGSGTVTHCAAAKSNASPPTGTQTILFRGDVTPSVATGSGVQPQLTTATAFTLD